MLTQIHTPSPSVPLVQAQLLLYPRQELLELPLHCCRKCRGLHSTAAGNGSLVASRERAQEEVVLDDVCLERGPGEGALRQSQDEWVQQGFGHSELSGLPEDLQGWNAKLLERLRTRRYAVNFLNSIVNSPG